MVILKIHDNLLFNADINPLASVPGLGVIYSAITHEKPIQEEEIESRTGRTDNRLARVIRNNVLLYHTINHEIFVQNIFRNTKASKVYPKMLFWQLSFGNLLFYILMKNVFLPYYFQGKSNIPKKDLIGFLKHENFTSSQTGEAWNESTIERIASKSLTLLKRLELLEGKAVKTIIPIYLSDQELCSFCYLLMSIYGDSHNFITEPFIKFSFLSKDIFIERVKVLAKKDLLGFKFTGDKLSIMPKYSYKEISYVLFN